MRPSSRPLLLPGNTVPVLCLPPRSLIAPMADHLHLFPFSTFPQPEHPTPMCVITDLFDVTEADWFSSRLDKSPSRTSSLPDPHPQTNQSPTERHQAQHKQVELELLTPDIDSPGNSFNVLTTQSDNQPFQDSLEIDFNPDLPLQISQSIQLDNHLPLQEVPSFGNQDLLKYTTLQDEQSSKQENDPNEPENLDNPVSQQTHSQPPVSPDQPFSAPETTLSVEPQSVDQMLQTVDQHVKLDNQIIDVDNPEPHVLSTLTTDNEQISFDDFYQAISLNGHPLPDVHTYIAALAGTTPLHEPSTFQEPKPRPRKKRKLSKREAARAASAAEMAREEELAMLAKTKQITDDELLRLKPKKQRRAARFDKPVPSRFCHVCSRTPKNVRLVVCCKIKEGICRKVICEKCFEEYNWGDFEQALKTDSSDWICPHCSGKCPERAQCRTYQRINDRLRVNRLKQEGPRNGKRRIRRQMEQRIESGDEKRPRFLLPAVAPGEFGGFDVTNQELNISGHGSTEIEVGESLD